MIYWVMTVDSCGYLWVSEFCTTVLLQRAFIGDFWVSNKKGKLSRG